MKVLLVVRQDSTAFEQMTDQERAPLLAQFAKVVTSLYESGAMITSAPLAAEARTLRQEASGIVASDGPFATGQEMLNGFMLFNAESLDEAEKIARGLPMGVGNSIELRVLQEVG